MGKPCLLFILILGRSVCRLVFRYQQLTSMHMQEHSSRLICNNFTAAEQCAFIWQQNFCIFLLYCSKLKMVFSMTGLHFAQVVTDWQIDCKIFACKFALFLMLINQWNRFYHCLWHLLMMYMSGFFACVMFI